MGVTASENESCTVFGVEEHNKLRRKHGYSDLQICPMIEAEAQKHAEMLASSTNSAQDTEIPMDKYWVSVSTSNKAEKTEALKDAVKKLQGKNGNAFHFLHPLVGSMGMGAAKKTNSSGKNEWIIVMLYNAPKLSRAMQYRGSI